MIALDPVAEIAVIPQLRRFGRITGVIGMLLEAGGPPQRLGVGGRCTVLARDGRRLPCEVVGFRARRALLMPFGDVGGAALGSKVEAIRRYPLLEAPR